jgi:hypothetical protein
MAVYRERGEAIEVLQIQHTRGSNPEFQWR